MLDVLIGFLHKKSHNDPSKIDMTPLVQPTSEDALLTTDFISNPLSSKKSSPVSEETHQSIKDKISHVFHHKQSAQAVEQPFEIPEKIESPSSIDTHESEVPIAIDEKFARLLKQDSTYHAMIRSEDLKNIQLQLSMRYMLLMLAIFIVIAWIVSNRVIMFGFSDFPLLARSRDALFALLTGLFSLTVWFGAAVWFRYRIVVILLRTLGCLLFLTVLVSIYLPFWR